MGATTQQDEQTWRSLWTHLAHQIVSTVGARAGCEVVRVGCGCGLRNRRNRSRALLIHPSSNGQAIGDLSLTVVGRGTQTIPRYHSDLLTYIDVVEDVIETTSRLYVEANENEIT